MMAEDEADGQAHSSSAKVMSEAEFKKLEMEADIRNKEDTIRNNLSPYEGYVMGIQGLLVWENPRRSLILLLCVNGFVWLLVTSNYNIVFKVTLSCIAAITAHTFYKKVWPDIKVEPKSPVPEGWTPLEPELVQFHDICHYMAVTWQYSLEKNRQFWDLRKREPGKFCLLVCSICICVMLFGLRVSGAVTTSLLVTCLVTVPGILHRGLHRQLYLKVKPYLTQMEHSLGGTPRKTKKKKRLRASRQPGEDEVDHSSSDDELHDFLPSPGPALDAALAHAAAPFENTPMSSSRVTPVSDLMPRGASLELTDDDMLTDENNSLAFSPLEDIPAYDQSDSHRVRHRRPKQRVPLEPPPLYQVAEPLLTRDMSETHFQAIDPNVLPRGLTPSSSSEDLLDTSPEIPTDSDNNGHEDAFDDDPAGLNTAQLAPEIEDTDDYHDARNTNTNRESPETVNPRITVEPTQGSSPFSQAASAFLSETIASVTSLVSGRRHSNVEPSGEASQLGSSGLPGVEPDLSDYEMLDTSEINDNERNSRTEEQEARDSSFTGIFSNLFSKQ